MTRPAHVVTTRHLGAAYPFAAEPGLRAPGVVVGRDLLGGVFAFDPFALYAHGTVTNPNLVVFGQIGRGKSALVKSYLWRQAAVGRRAWVVDPKGEYGPLAQAWGVTPLRLRPGGALRLNPLEAPSALGSVDEPVRRRGELLVSLAAAGMGRGLLPSERSAVELAVASVSSPDGPVPTLPDVVDALLAPTPQAAAAVRTDQAGLAADGRQVALELRRLVTGDLRGMFDGPTSAGVDLQAPLVVLDLSAVYHSAALGILMTCATAWLQAQLHLPPQPHSAAAAPIGDDRGAAGRRRQPSGAGGVLVVVDEAWAILSDVAVARWLQASWKLARARGVANLAVLHRVSDLSAGGPAGSQQIELAHGLLADSETRVVYAQPPGEVPLATELLQLSTTEAALVPRLRRGVALWKVGGRSFLVQHLLSPGEVALVDTDGAMSPRSSAGQGRVAGSGSPSGVAGSGSPSGVAGSGSPSGVGGSGSPSGVAGSGAPAGHSAAVVRGSPPGDGSSPRRPRRRP